jgi:hypothetical protein
MITAQALGLFTEFGLQSACHNRVRRGICGAKNAFTLREVNRWQVMWSLVAQVLSGRI